MEEYVYKHNKRLRCGYTTGSCAAAAAQRAAALVLGAGIADDAMIGLVTPKGITLRIPVEKTELGPHWASCAVKKDSGDDPDVTNGILVYAKVTKIQNPAAVEGEIKITGGMGIGKVTRPGLACPVGEAAINPVPRQMIAEQVKMVCAETHYKGTMLVEISIPAGVEIAQRTFNPRLGIAGGISVLGTSGLVEPMSEQALIDTIKVEMNVIKASGAEYLAVTPGNYGETFLEQYLGIEKAHLIKCSNFIGETLDYAELCQIKGVLLVGHIGKLVKLAGGIMNTHSRWGDARMEIIGVHAALAGASRRIVQTLLECRTTDAAIMVLDEAGIRQATMQSILQKVDFHIKQRVHDSLEIGAILFSNQYGYLGETRDAAQLLAKLTRGDGDHGTNQA
jgi:cobalamin biosynthesis protein CbiD